MKKPTPTEYRRNLPHIQPQGGMFFITFRLYGSIPISVLEKISEAYEIENTTDISGKVIKNLKTIQQENYFIAIDEYLDSNANDTYHLAKPEIAQLVYDSIKFRDNRDYKLVCFSIMSNHVHMLIYKLVKPLDRVMKELKSYTGKEALKLLRKEIVAPATFEKSSVASTANSKFWQKESFDRIVRNKMDLANKIAYTINNPVKAGLVKNWKDWKWTYCRPEFLEM
ncbi:MAG: transposase [Salinivirgaceae bacterium]|nr:transposase [Salinivirgaceae bacterium]